jgi:site-specific recombinase XerD
MKNKRNKQKCVPLNKQSKSAQAEYYAQQRGSWNGVNYPPPKGSGLVTARLCERR